MSKVINMIFVRYQKITILQIVQKLENVIDVLIEKEFVSVSQKNIVLHVLAKKKSI